MIKLSQITVENIRGYLQGNLRKFLSTLPNGVPDYIMEQIQYRLSEMDINCLERGYCPCNCSVPEKQYEDRSCERGCYPDMMSKEDWERYKISHKIELSKILEKLKERESYL